MYLEMKGSLQLKNKAIDNLIFYWPVLMVQIVQLTVNYSRESATVIRAWISASSPSQWCIGGKAQLVSCFSHL